jgi:hypothetical protein
MPVKEIVEWWRVAALQMAVESRAVAGEQGPGLRESLPR